MQFIPKQVTCVTAMQYSISAHIFPALPYGATKVSLLRSYRTDQTYLTDWQILQAIFLKTSHLRDSNAIFNNQPISAMSHRRYRVTQ